MSSHRNEAIIKNAGTQAKGMCFWYKACHSGSHYLDTGLNWYPFIELSHCSSFEDWVPIDFIYGYPIFKCVAVIWQGWEGTKIVVPKRPTRWYAPLLNICTTQWGLIQYKDVVLPVPGWVYRKFHFEDKTITRSSNLHTGDFLYW